MLPVAQRVAILVDSENLEITVAQNYEVPRTLRRTHRAYPNWKMILPLVTGRRTLIRNIYYKKQQKKISPKFKRLWEDELQGEIKQPIKSVDPYIIVDAITLAEKTDSLIILAGDKDYLPLIWYLKSRGCKVEIAAFEHSVAKEIREAADRFYLLKSKHTVSIERSS